MPVVKELDEQLDNTSAETASEVVSPFKPAEADAPPVHSGENTVNPTGWDKAESFLRQYSPVTSFFADPQYKEYYFQGNDPEPNFNLAASLDDAGVDKGIRASYQWCRSKADVDEQTEYLRLEAHDRDIVANSGIMESFLYSAPAMLDPVNIAATAGAAAAAVVAAPEAAVVATAAVVGSAGAYVSGKARQASQNMLSDSQVNAETAAGAIFGAAFSACGKAIGSAWKSKYIEAIKDRLATNWSDMSFSFKKKVQYTPKADGTIKEHKIADMPKWFQTIYSATPVGKCATSEFETANKVGRMFFRTDYITEYTKAGLDSFPSMEAIIETRRGNLLFVEKDYITSVGKYLNSEYAKSTGVNFGDAVRETMLSGTHHESSEVTRTASDLKKYINGMFQEANEAKIIQIDNLGQPMQAAEGNVPYLTAAESHLTKEELTTRVSQGILDQQDVFYFPRVWDISKVLSNRETLLQLLEMSAIKQGKPNPKEFAEGQFMHIIGAAEGERWSIPDVKVSATSGGALDKERTVLVDDRLLTQWVVTDPLEITKAVHHKLVPAIAMKKTLKANGYDNFAQVLKELDSEYVAKLAAAPNDQGVVLHEQYKDAARLIKDIPLLVDGMYGKDNLVRNPRSAASLHSLRNFNYARNLGGMLLSSLNDPQLLVNTWGLKPVLKSYLKEFSHAVGITKPAAPKVMKEELQRLGVGIELAVLDMANRMDVSSMHPMRYLLDGNKISDKALAYTIKASDWSARKLTKWSGIAWWNDFNKRVNGNLYCDRLLEACINEEKSFLSQMRVPADMAKRIAKQYQEFGELYDGFRIPNSQLWSDVEAKEVFGASVVTNLNNTVLIPGAGEVPMWFKNTTGKIFINYRSYGFAILNNLSAKWANGQREHMTAVALTGTGMTALGLYLKSLSRGDPYMLDDPEFYKEVALRSDLGGWVLDTVKTTHNLYSSTAEHGQAGLFRALSRESPALGLLGSIGDTVNYLTRESDRPMNEYELRNVVYISPFVTLPIVNGIVNNWIRGHVEESGGKLAKTRKERYWENK